MAKINVCGVKVPASGMNTYGGGHIAPTARNLGQYAKVSKATAKKLAASAGRDRPPRPGYEMTLCNGVYLSNSAGRFEVVSRGPGENLFGVRRRRR